MSRGEEFRAATRHGPAGRPAQQGGPPPRRRGGLRGLPLAVPVALCLVATTPAGLADRAHTPLCAPGTPAVFSCTVAGGKVLSLCGSPPASLQYRFGTPARVELAFPADPAEGTRRMRFAHYSRYQVDRTTVAFEQAGVGYTVFDDTEGRSRQAGVEVMLPAAPEGGASAARGATERTFRCRGPITGSLLPLKPHLPCDAESALQGGTCR